MDQLSKIVVEVETKGLDEAIEKMKQFNELMEKNIKLQEKSMRIVVEVETKGLDEAIEKMKQFNELMEKNIKLQEKSMSAAI